jgi:hypothetical protein
MKNITVLKQAKLRTRDTDRPKSKVVHTGVLSNAAEWADSH